MSIRTILDVYKHDLQQPRAEHVIHQIPGDRRALSTRQLEESTAALADTLADLGVGTGDRVMVLCDNRPEWHIVDLAVLSLGAVDVPIYSTLTTDQIAYQVRDSDAVVAVAENPDYASRLLEVQPSCPQLAQVVQVEGEHADGVLGLDDITRQARPDAIHRLWERAERVTEDDLATIVYTSGTTGEAKGVMLTHRNIATNVREIMERTQVGEQDDLGLEFLPLCHMIERVAGYCYMARRVTRAYCSVHDVAELMSVVAPTAFASVPRVLEKVHAAILRRAEGGPPIRRAMFHWAIRAGTEAARCAASGRPAGPALRMRHQIADRLVLSKIRAALGGRIRASFCGGAALPVHVHEFFRAIGLLVQEAYGLTETSPVITLNGSEPGTLRIGSVGRPLPSYELAVAPDGELLARGPSVTPGYWAKPERTAEAFDDDGFFHTGDIATIDDDGFVFITDRKKDLIVTAGGKNVAPQPIENRLKSAPFIDLAVLVGDGRPYVVALLSPGEEALIAWAADHGLGELDLPDLVSRPEVQTLYEHAVDAVNRDLARFEQIKRFSVIPRAMTIEGGQLTPTMKVKRRVVAEEYAGEIEEMYGGG